MNKTHTGFAWMARLAGAGGTATLAAGLTLTFIGAPASAATVLPGSTLWEVGTFNPGPTAAVTRIAAADQPSLAPGTGPSAAIEERSTKKPTIPLPAPKAMQLGRTGPLSHLKWHSGASCGGAAFESWRQRKLDVITGWAPITSYPAMVHFSTGLHNIAAQPGWFTVGVPMVTNDKKGQLGACASGAFDSYYRQFARNMAGNKLTDSIIRIGWEGNGDWFPWSGVGRTAAFKACFTRIAKIFKQVSPGFRIEWPMAKKGRVFPVSQLYPGDGVVDIIGITFYDRFPNYPTQAVWDKELNTTIHGGPWGLQAWLNFAKAHKKKLAVAEWGINNGYPQGGKYGIARDEPVYVANMFNFFKKNAASMAYETVFNCDHPTKGEKYVLFPVKPNPRSSATYRSLWSKG